MNEQEKAIEKKLLDEVERALKGHVGTLETAIRLHGEFVRSVAVKMDAETRKSSLKRN